MCLPRIGLTLILRQYPLNPSPIPSQFNTYWIRSGKVRSLPSYISYQQKYIQRLQKALFNNSNTFEDLAMSFRLLEPNVCKVANLDTCNRSLKAWISWGLCTDLISIYSFGSRIDLKLYTSMYHYVTPSILFCPRSVRGDYNF